MLLLQPYGIPGLNNSPISLRTNAQNLQAISDPRDGTQLAAAEKHSSVCWVEGPLTFQSRRPLLMASDQSGLQFSGLQNTTLFVRSLKSGKSQAPEGR